MKHLSAILLFIFGFVLSAFGQVITTEPEFPTAQDSVAIYFDATKGTGGLENYSGDIYAHAGVITDQSTDGSDWKYVIAEWNENIPKAKLERIDTNLYKLDITPSIREYYGVPEGETIEKMAFVFRNSDGSKEGKAEGGKDIYAEVYQDQFSVKIVNPTDTLTFIQTNETLSFMGVASTENNTDLELFVDGQQVKSITDDTLTYDFQKSTEGNYLLEFVGYNSSLDSRDTVSTKVITHAQQTDQDRPANLKDGITYVDNNTVRLSLFAPHKNFVYLIGDFTDWDIKPEFQMNKDVVNSDSTYFWIEFDVPQSGEEYGFQYLVDGNIRVTDPYVEKILNEYDDPYIDESTYPNLKPYPKGKTEHLVGVLQPGKTEYQWQNINYDRPAKENLMVYELLVRDFVENHDYKTLADTLDYLDSLGVNAIELMPVMEFEGNISWGYNSALHFATDKYYGPAEDLKKFIDEAHSRNIVVILDMVLNHVYGQSPLVRLWNEGTYGKPTSENPYMNVESPNQTFNWGNDFNHESAATQYYVDRVTRFWLEEFNADGYRFDFTKGFTQNSGDGWAYDSDRIRILKRMADQQWAVDDSSYVILEHLSENSEEKELADYGMLLWGNMNHSYGEASLGYHDNGKSNFSGISYKSRGWNDPHLVGYMESHDEERLMYKNLQYGNSATGYDITNLSTALDRIKLSSAFFFTVPGPKMVWQFGELGYDKSINLCEDGSIQNSCRTSPKPITWNYYSDSERKKLYNMFKALIRLRNSHAAFTSDQTTINMQVNDAVKRITLTHPDMDVSIIGNFGVQQADGQPSFATNGTWYDFLSGDSLNVSNTDTTISMVPGEFHIYTTKKFESPDGELISFEPTQFDVQISRSFNEASSPADYRLVALPGQITEKISSVMNGDAGVAWQAYWDNGESSNYLVKYDGSSTFNLTPGNGFWVTSKNDFTYQQTVPTVELNANDQASIPLQDGWNIISNPLHKDVSWSDVSNANGGNLQSLWSFDGSFSQATNFASARSGEAYYFLNKTGLNELLIPYEKSSSKNKQETKQKEIALNTFVDGNQTSISKLTFVSGEQKRLADIVAPPSNFENAALRFSADPENQKSTRSSSFAQIFRNPKQEGHKIPLTLSATPKQPVTISAKGLNDAFNTRVALLNTFSGRKYELSGDRKIKIIPEQENTSMLLLIGSTSFINEQQEQFLPKQIEINPNYPNPFNPTTTLRFSLPEQAEVRLEIYNVLGQKVSTLIDNKVQSAGFHTVSFDASRQASGMYYAVFTIGDQRYTQKMMLIK